MRCIFGLLTVLAVGLSADVRCLAADSNSPPEFSVEVMSVLSKAGCNLGTCHGNLNGKGGLKLSLRGQNPDDDYRALVRASRGRRVNLAAPNLSLFLQKACGEVSHGGGIRFDAHSPEYQLLEDWLRAGAEGPSSDAPRVIALDVHPESAIIEDPLDHVEVRVRATFSDGTVRDVTHIACYELSNLNADVDTDGIVSRTKFGETTLIVRYLNQQRPISIAFIENRPNFVWSDPPVRNAIDRHVYQKLKRLKINPSPLADDNTFVRRAFLDAIGRLPTAEEAQAFVADSAPDKRNRLIDGLLVRPEFADFWAIKWADVLRAEEKVLDTKGVEVFHRWIRDGIAQGKSLDRFARDLITATGSTFDNPPANYYRANRDPSTRGETTARLFLGTRLQCAKCHNHPFDRWTQDDYYGWSSLFSQLDYEIGDNERQDKLDKNEFAGDQTVLVAKVDEVQNPSTGQIAVPKFLGGDTLPGQSGKDRLEATARWLTSPDNDLFVRSQANFIWYQLMGLGVVDPIDDFRLTNPPSNPELMDELATELKLSGFDVRHLVALIMKSRTYQLASQPNGTNVNDATCFSRAYVGRLPAEVILDMQSDVLDRPARFLGQDAGIRAVQLPGVLSKQARRSGPMPGDRFLKTFGKPDRILACDCERSNETTLKQAFVLIGDGLNERLAEGTNRLAKLAQSSLTDEQVVEQLYWTALSRAPSDPEKEAALEMIAHTPRDRGGILQSVARSLNLVDDTKTDRFVALQDIAWALMNAKEFLFRR